MADLTDMSLGPDLGEIERGNARLTADAISIIWLQLQALRRRAGGEGGEPQPPVTIQDQDRSDEEFGVAFGAGADIVGGAGPILGGGGGFAHGGESNAQNNFESLQAQISGLGTGFGVSSVTDLTIGQIRSANTAPVDVITGVSGKIIVPFFWTFEEVRGATGFSGTPTFTLRYSGVAVDILQGIPLITGGTVNSYRWTIASQADATFAKNFGTAAVKGVKIQFRSNADIANGSGAWRLGIAYYTVGSNN